MNQEYKNFETLIIDDGSNYQSFNTSISLIKNPNFRYYYQKNKGVASAKNLGLKNSKGKFITFLDSDDEYKFNHLSTRYKILEDNNFDFLHGGIEIIGNKFVPDKNNREKLISIENCVVGGTFFIKNEVIQKIGYFDKIKYSEDSEYFDRVNDLKLSIGKTNKKTYIYHRDVENSICNKIK